MPTGGLTFPDGLKYRILFVQLFHSVPFHSRKEKIPNTDKKGKSTCTMEPRFNGPLYNEVLGITNDIFQPSNSVVYGKEPRRHIEPSIK